MAFEELDSPSRRDLAFKVLDDACNDALNEIRKEMNKLISSRWYSDPVIATFNISILLLPVVLFITPENAWLWKIGAVVIIVSVALILALSPIVLKALHIYSKASLNLRDAIADFQRLESKGVDPDVLDTTGVAMLKEVVKAYMEAKRISQVLTQGRWNLAFLLALNDVLVNSYVWMVDLEKSQFDCFVSLTLLATARRRDDHFCGSISHPIGGVAEISVEVSGAAGSTAKESSVSGAITATTTVKFTLGTSNRPAPSSQIGEVAAPAEFVLDTGTLTVPIAIALHIELGSNTGFTQG
ncbi:hypothetical protein BT96DRAFT_918285 [Gymnopus androsaceus JB14]|uniref:Uncharacterized protein n=1 Tax=Gymnopus androsaceus JB14 TaxID=1447944 RepID=A0A6A4HUY0_9AGAR|nr:hypothetical protein BT96DRAFT_918285 [Gymnopus androsaceus JB14]